MKLLVSLAVALNVLSSNRAQDCHNWEADPKGLEYEGTQSSGLTHSTHITYKGLEYECQNWSTNSPNENSSNYKEDNNYCRNPDNDSKGPWCYLKDYSKSFYTEQPSGKKKRWPVSPNGNTIRFVSNFAYCKDLIPQCEEAVDAEPLTFKDAPQPPLPAADVYSGPFGGPPMGGPPVPPSDFGPPGFGPPQAPMGDMRPSDAEYLPEILIAFNEAINAAHEQNNDDLITSLIYDKIDNLKTWYEEQKAANPECDFFEDDPFDHIKEYVELDYLATDDPENWRAGDYQALHDYVINAFNYFLSDVEQDKIRCQNPDDVQPMW